MHNHVYDKSGNKMLHFMTQVTFSKPVTLTRITIRGTGRSFSSESIDNFILSYTTDNINWNKASDGQSGTEVTTWLLLLLLLLQVVFVK